MSASVALTGSPVRQVSNAGARSGTSEPTWVRWTLISLALGFVFLFLLLPLAAVFTEALRK